MIFLGVDGGGTKTKAVAVDPRGRVVREVSLGSSYLPALGREGLERVLQELLEALPEPPRAAVLGLGGYGEVARWDEAYREVVASRFPGPFRLLNDVELAWHAAFGGEEGVLVVAGTGSMAYGRGPLGVGRAGGYGPLFGDEGSAYWIAVQALNRASRAEDGRAGPTALQGLPRVYGKENLLELLAFLEEEPGGLRARLAALAEEVDRLAQGGDQGAREVLERAAGELFLLARSLALRLGTRRVAYWGSVFRSPVVKGVFSALVLREGLEVVEGGRDPALYAALWARDLATHEEVRP